MAALRVLVGLLASGLIMSFLALPLYFACAPRPSPLRRRLEVRDVSLEEGTTPRATGKAMLLMLPLALAPWWVFLLSQLLLEELGLGCRPPGPPGLPGPP